MKKIVRIFLKLVAIFIVLILLAFAGGWIYLKQHKKQVISFIENQAKNGLNGGEVHIADISIGFRHTFPRIAFTIDSLSLRDSLWSRHHHDLITVARAYATLDFFKFITGKINIGRVQLESPHFYMFTDSTGYTNTSVFKKNNPSKPDAPKDLSYPIIEVTNGLLSVDKQDAHKFFGFDIKSLECTIRGSSENEVLTIAANLECRVQRMTFNMDKGPFLEGKTVVGDIIIQFNKASKILQFKNIKLVVDEQPFVFTGKFFLADVPTPFLLSWETDNLSFRKAASFLSANIRLKLDTYDISETITHLTGSMDNSEAEYKTPLIHLKLNVENKTIKTPVLDLNSASFTATFNNEEIPGKGHEDSNTVMHFMPFRASWEKLAFHCDSVVIRDLVHPRMNINILSNFPLENINNVFADNTIAFTKGRGKMNLMYRGSLETAYDSSRSINGEIHIDSASITYLPRNLLFARGKGMIRFVNKDMIIDNLNLNAGSSDLIMNGTVKNLFYLINDQNKKLSLDWNIRSNKLNLNDFLSYLTFKPATKVVKKKSKSGFSQTVTNFTSLLETANINLILNAKQFIYNKFKADNLVANLDMDDNKINLKKIKLQNAGGTIAIQGLFRNEASSNPFSFTAQLKNLNVSQLFAGFNNFGLQSPTDKNLAGTITADVTLSGGFTTKAKLIPEETKGFVKFNIENGQLINFEPVQKIQQTVFKKRDFSDIQFADLHDLLEINGQNVTVNPMEIRSTVLTMFVEGVYNMKTGPDLSIQVPLSNLKASKDSVLENKGIFSKKGVSARLRATRGDDGKIKIAWDPFNKSGKKLKEKYQKKS